MPIYEYNCPRCGSFEVSQRISDKPLARCPTCRSKVRKLISASAFLLKGGGWYADGYQKPAGKSSATDAGEAAKPAAETAVSTPAASGSSPAGSSDKPAAPATNKQSSKAAKPAKAAS